MALRDYQAAVIEGAYSALAVKGSAVIQMPTGSGKTVTAVEIARQEMARGPVWFLCHRREIVRQAMRAFRKAGIAFGVIAPGHPAEPDALVQIASIPTLLKRSEIYPAPATILWDECHHATARTWSGLMRRHLNARHIGLTATPERLDGKGLSDLFGAMVCGPSIKELIAAGHLSPYRIFAPTEPDLKAAKLSMGDYRTVDLERAMNTPVVIGDAVEHYNRITPNGRALVFAVSVEASKAVAARFNAQGTPALHIDGDTPDDVRDAALVDLEAGRIRVLSNVNVFTEGVDVPAIDTVILLRPTKSLVLYLQMIGRGLRPAEGKSVATILDHSGAVYEHGEPDADWQWSLDGGARKRRLEAARKKGEAIRRCPKCSRAHARAAECPECGYEYPTGREVGEFDGALYELRGAPPDGCDTKLSFRLRVGASRTTMSAWFRRDDFPKTGDGFVLTAQALEWVKRLSNRKLGSSDRRLPNVVSGITAKQLAATTGIPRVVVYKYMKADGFPLMDDGSIDERKAIAWIDENRRRAVPSGAVSPCTLSKKLGISQSAAASYFRAAGFPVRDDGFADESLAIDWVSQNKARVSGRRKGITPRGRETQMAFSKRLCLAERSASNWVKKGLPVDGMGFVRVLKALEWVRDNTKIAIPESAWEGVERADILEDA